MRGTTSFKLLGLSALFLLVAGCVTWEDQNKERKRSTQKAIGVRAIQDCPNLVHGQRVSECLELVPYIARVRRGDTVIWYSPDGDLRIEFQKMKAGAGPTPLDNPPCEKRRLGGICVLAIGRDKLPGQYPYFPHVRTPDGRDLQLNQGEVDIKP